MNWVSSSLQLAGTLLESVDQHAALSLTGDVGSGDEEDGVQSGEGLLSTLKSRISHATEAVSATTGSGGDSADESELQTSEAPSESELGTSQIDGADAATLGAARVLRTPPISSSSRLGSSWTAGTPSPPRSSSGATVSASPEEECVRLRKELARVKADARAKDKALSAAQKRLRVCEDEIEALEKECAGRIADVQEQLAHTRQEKDTDERHFVQALALKDAQAQTVVLELEALQDAKRLQTEEVAALRAELAKAVESKESEWTSAAVASASNDSQQLVYALRAELAETLAAMATLKKEHEAARMSMFARQAQLEKANAELANDVARLERELVRTREASSSSGVTSTTASTSAPLAAAGASTREAPVSTLSDDYRRVQQTLVVTKKTLHDALQTSESQKQELLVLRDELRRAKLALEASEQRAAQELFVARRESESLRDQLSATAASNHGAAVTEARIHTLTNRLVEKQEALDALRSKTTTLEIRLADAQSRSLRAEERLAEIERNGGVLDMEMATPVGKRGGSGGARARANRMANMISRVAPVVERSSRVVTALDVLDRWLLFLGRVFLSYPFARLGLLCYVALVHFWVFVVLSFHTSHLSEEMQTQHQQHAAAVAAADPDGGLFPSSP